MEQILNLKHLGGIDDLRPFFGEIQAIKQGKYYHLVGDAHLNHTEFARFTKRPRFSSMGTVIYAGLTWAMLLEDGIDVCGIHEEGPPMGREEIIQSI